MGKKLKGALVIGGTAAAIEYGIALYFFRRTMIRNNAKQERTVKMSGTDWDCYKPEMKRIKEWRDEQIQEDVFITSRDNLKLHGTYFPVAGSMKTVICFHGYTSKGLDDYIGLSEFYLSNGYNMLLVDERAHGDSEGKYIGFGVLDRWDALKWIDFIQKKSGNGGEIILHGISMGGATVLMASGLKLPDCIKAIISDCAFTSAYDVFVSVLKNSYHLPAFPIMDISDGMARKHAGYGLAEVNAAKEVKKASVPILFIHGDADTFVPCRMCMEIYENCASPKELLIVEGAGHAEAFYKQPEVYKEKMKKFLNIGGETK